MKRIIVIVAALFLASTANNVFAQSNRVKLNLGYSIAAPLGSFKNDFINNTSFRGATGEISYLINPKFSAGLSTGFQNFYQKYGRQVYHTPNNETISAVVTNTMEIIPVLLKGTFNPMGTQASFIQPYVSLGAGVNLVNYRQYLGEFPGNDASVNFAAQAGAGVLVPFSKSNNQTGIRLGATYNHGAYKRNNIENLNTVGVNAGVVFNLR